jgi:hypothetical protein
MNCLRSLEYIKKINSKYKKHGLKTTLIHPPEWEFEKNRNNISRALKKYRINLSIMIDKDKKLIKKLKLNFWPTQILIKNNKTIYKHIGEGNYKKLENKIRTILKTKSKRIFNKEPKYTKFPTVYAGKKKKGSISNLKNKLKFGIIYKKGNWKQNNEFLQGSGSITIKTQGKITSFTAKSLNKKSINIKTKIDNKLIKNITINNPQLYNILRLKNNTPKKLTLETKSKIAIYSFSFQ